MFGPYRVVRQIGAGGMGAVYLGQHELIGRFAAIKVLLPELSAQKKSVDRFFNEARATSAVSDPGIVQIYDFGFTPEQIAYIVMEFLEGESLDKRLTRVQSLPTADALRITRQVAGSLAAAHAAGIVHRDLKPDNLFMVRDSEAGGERAKILDFGIAKLSDDDAKRMVTRTGQVIGTPVYMSPEQCGGSPTVDHRADIYSLGCVLFQMLSGRPPFDVAGMYAVISAHLRDTAPSISEVAPHVPPEVNAILVRCLAKKPADRFANRTELQHACDELLAGSHEYLALSRPPSTSDATWPLRAANQTTLGQSVGEPLAPRTDGKRIAVWIGSAALAIGIGVAIALVTVHTGRRVDIAPAAIVASPPPVERAALVPADAAAVPADATAVLPMIPAIAPVDATVVSPTATHVHDAPRPPKSKTTEPPDDMYDDRN
jgi:serine/threonine protein kinase